MKSKGQKQEYPLVYILVLNWNNYPDTARCIESLKKLDYPNYRLVAVDNGSTDRSVERLRERFPNLKIIRTGSNLGFAGGNNVGISHALENDAELIWLLNNDTVVNKHALTPLVDTITQSRETGLVGSSIYKYDEPDRVETHGGGRIRYPTAQLIYNTGNNTGADLDYISGTSMLIKREVLEKSGMLDECFFMYWEDVEFTQRVKKLGYKVAYAPESIVYHREHGSLAGGDGFLQREYLFAKGTVLFYKKQIQWWPLALSLAYGGKIINRMLQLEFGSIRVVTRGFWDGLTE